MVFVTPKPTLLILGSSGFIGSYIVSEFSSKFKIRTIRHDQTLCDSLLGENIDIIINASATAYHSSYSVARSGNFLWPNSVLNASVRINPSLCWIQLASYSELQIKHGLKSDYAIQKAEFREVLRKRVSGGGISLRTIFLPHVFGNGERPERLISSLRTAVFSRTPMSLTSGKQYLPLLSVQEALESINKVIIERDLNEKNMEYSASPFWYGSVIDLVQEISGSVDKDLFTFNPSRHSVDVDLPRVKFPSPIPIRDRAFPNLWAYLNSAY